MILCYAARTPHPSPFAHTSPYYFHIEYTQRREGFPYCNGELTCLLVVTCSPSDGRLFITPRRTYQGAIIYYIYIILYYSYLILLFLVETDSTTIFSYVPSIAFVALNGVLLIVR